MQVHSLIFGRDHRNASCPAVGNETAHQKPGSTTAIDVDGLEACTTKTDPMVTLKISVVRDIAVPARVKDAIFDATQYQEPVILCLRIEPAGPVYNPQNDNPNHGRNTPRALPTPPGRPQS